MAIQRLALSDIIEEIRRNLGEPTAAQSHIDDADLVRVINGYGQRLQMRMASVRRELGKYGMPYLNMWKTSINSTTGVGIANFTVSQGSSTVTFPDDYNLYISFYDRTTNRPIDVTSRVSKWHFERLKEAPAGPPEAIELTDRIAASNRQQATLYPAPLSSVTPDIEMFYWRYPATMPNTAPTAEYPDADIQFHWMWVDGPTAQLMAPSDPAFNRFHDREREGLMDLAVKATWI